jgi:hypothetical protein
MPLRNASDRGLRAAPPRGGFDLGVPRGVAPELPLGAYEAAGLSSAVALRHAAETDAQLAAHLMTLPSLERQAAALHDARFHRATLAKFLALHAESELFDQGGDPRPTAELAAAIASAVPRDPGGQARRAAADAYWLFGKALLKARQFRLADDSFQCMFAFIREHGPSEARALAAVGRAQLSADTGDLEAAVSLFLIAAYGFAQLGSAQSAAACQAELGLLLLGAGDLVSARISLAAAAGLLDAAAAPSLAARLRLALAEVATALDDRTAAGEELARARALYGLAPDGAAGPEALERRWREARIAAAAGDSAVAAAWFDSVRSELLVRGSLSEAARCTFDALLLRVDARRGGEAGDLTGALAQAFPGQGEVWAAEMERLGQMAALDPERLYAACWELRDRLRRAEIPDPGRPPLLRPPRSLSDRVLRRRGEFEDPVGAARAL